MFQVDLEKEYHRLHHGTVSPDAPDLPVNAPRRRIALENVHPMAGNSGLVPVPIQEQSFIDREMAKCHFCQLAHFTDFDLYRVTISNLVDDATLPKNFKFIQEPVLREGVERAEQSFRLGCECIRSGDCLYEGCSCLQDVEAEDGQMAVRGRRKHLAAFIERGPFKYCLKASLLSSRDPVYECHDGCHCSALCPNRVVERGRRIPLDIFRTSNGRGWGVRSPVEIQKGQFVDKYVGEILTSAEANQRRQQASLSQRKDVYLFALDKFSDPDSLDPRLAGEPFEVDGEFMGGPTRFINHSCEPNLRIFARVGDHADKHIHDLAFFAIKHIPAGTELTFDYIDGEDSELLTDETGLWRPEAMTVCLCGSKHCRGYLW